MKVIKASEFGTYSFCRRAWWYSASGVEPESTKYLEEGIQAHDRHGTGIRSIVFLRYTAIILLVLGLLTLLVFGMMRF